MKFATVTTMTILDRYMLWQYVRVFLMTFTCLMGMYVVADLMTNLTEFTEHGERNVSLMHSVRDYYFARIPWFFEVAGRVVGVLSAVVTVGWLHRHHELTALMAAGVPRWRVAQPMIAIAAIVAMAGILNREYWLPTVRDQLCHSIRDMTTKQGEQLTPQYDNETDILIDGQRLIAARRRIVEPNFRLPTEWTPLGRTLRAESATYLAPLADRPGGYLLNNVATQVDLGLTDSYDLRDQTVVFTPYDASWLTNGQLFVVSGLSIEQLKKSDQWQQFSSTRQLIAGLNNSSLDFGANTRVLIHSRFVQPLLDMILVMLGLPIALGATKGMYATTGKSVLAVTFFSAVVLGCQGAGTHGLLAPTLAAWMPLMILTPLAILCSTPLRK